MTPTVALEAVTAESIMYQRGNIYIKLEGFYAWLYRGMIRMYGKADATERFWWHWHKKEGSVILKKQQKENHATYNDNGDYTTC